MGSILLLIPWAGTVSGRINPTGTFLDFLIALALTAGVASLARRSEKEKARLRDARLASAHSAPGVH